MKTILHVNDQCQHFTGFSYVVLWYLSDEASVVERRHDAEDSIAKEPEIEWHVAALIQDEEHIAWSDQLKH
jgi:predicted ATPase